MLREPLPFTDMTEGGETLQWLTIFNNSLTRFCRNPGDGGLHDYHTSCVRVPDPKDAASNQKCRLDCLRRAQERQHCALGVQMDLEAAGASSAPSAASGAAEPAV